MLDIIRKQRFAQIAITLLVLLNLALITSIVWHERSGLNTPPPEAGLEQFLEIELDLTPAQVEKMHAIRRQHFQSGRSLAEALRDSSEMLLVQAFLPELDSARAEELSANIGQIHAKLEWALYQHFVQLSKICSPQQKIKLSELTRELTRGNGPEAPGRPPQPGMKPGPDAHHPGRRPGVTDPPPRDR